MSESATISSTALKALFSESERHLVGCVTQASLIAYPFPFFYAAEAFSPAFYAEMTAQLPSRDSYKRISETGRARAADDYENRLILLLGDDLPALSEAQSAFWRSLKEMLAGPAFTNAILGKFAATLMRDLSRDLRTLQYSTEVLLVKDLDGYVIGPHTDVKNRAISIMFYMPSSPCYERHGTSIYEPKQPGMTSNGSGHFGFGDFTRLATMPCRANSMFAFQRNDVSFHGVEAIEEPDCERDVLLYILRWRDKNARP